MIEKMSFEFQDNDITASLGFTVGNTFALEWTDGINRWKEEFPTLSVALLRLAALMECRQSDWHRGFSQQPTEFAVEAWQFLDTVTG
jgi:hypothetical protein